MNVLFKALGLLLAGWGRTFRPTDRPLRYWSAIAAYTLLSVALMFWF
jgi:hypothetical protein